MLNTLPLAQLLRFSIKTLLLSFSLEILAVSGTCANATTTTMQQSINSRQHIAKQDRSSANINHQKQTDLEGIHQTLTQYYSGANELNVEQMERASLSLSADDKASNQQIFNEIKVNHINLSVEVQNIELLSMSGQKATVKVDEVMKLSKGLRSGGLQRSVAFMMVKVNGKWKIVNFNNLKKPVLFGDRF
jgi:hypothetical protein